MSAKTIPFGPIKIDLLDYSSRANGILGIRDSGKTYTATYLAEQIHHKGVPFIAFDPSGVWKSLRFPGKGPGLPVVVAGPGGDLPLTPTTAATIVESAMASGVSLVMDFSSIEFSKADWRRIVLASVKSLLMKNAQHGLRHVFLEEAAEYVPQRPTDGETFAIVEKLVRVGGNARLGATIINQRAAEVAKSVLELCDNLLLHRQRGKNSIESLSRWLDVAEVEGAASIIASLSSLPTGECWTWLGQDLHATRVKVPAKDSLHPDRRVMRGELKVSSKKAVDVGEFVSAMRGSLGKIEEEAKANDPAMLKAEIRKQAARIAELEKQATAAPATVDPAAIDIAYRDGMNQALADASKEFDLIKADLASRLANARSTVNARFDEIAEIFDQWTIAVPDRKPKQRGIGHVLVDQPKTTNGSKPIPVAGSPGYLPKLKGDLEKPLQKIIDAIAWWKRIGIAEPTAPQAAFKAGYSFRGGTWSTYLSRLRSAGMIEARSLKLTEAGDHAANWPTTIGRSADGDFREEVLGQIPEPLRRILKPLIEVYPQPYPNASDLAEAAGYSPAGGTWSTYLSRLRSLELIERRSLKAQDWLFP